MADNLTKEQRSYNMSRIRSKNTKPEKALKKLLTKTGFKYQPNLLGKPDFADKKNKTAVFIDGCFWHKCPKHFKEPKTNRTYWIPKLEKNKKRDKKINLDYKKRGWKVVRIWEHELK